MTTKKFRHHKDKNKNKYNKITRRHHPRLIGGGSSSDLKKEERIDIPNSVPDKIIEKFDIKDPEYKMQCAPKPDGETQLGFSCFSEEALNKLRDLWNERHPTNKIEAKSPREVWEHLKTAMAKSCESVS